LADGEAIFINNNFLETSIFFSISSVLRHSKLTTSSKGALPTTNLMNLISDLDPKRRVILKIFRFLKLEQMLSGLGQMLRVEGETTLGIKTILRCANDGEIFRMQQSIAHS